jgi:excisionase family DNA binding protein
MGPPRSSPFLRPRLEAFRSTDVTVADGASTIDQVDGNIESIPPSPSKSRSKILSSNIPLWAAADVRPGHRSGWNQRGRPDQFDPETGTSAGRDSAVVKERLSLSKRRVAAGRAFRLEPLLTVGETAAILNVSARTVRRLIASGAIPAISIGRSVRLGPHDICRLVGEGGVCNH